MASPRHGQPFGPLPFDRHDSIHSSVVKETFLSAQALAAITGSGVLEGDVSWTVTDEVGAATADVTVETGEANAPGIVKLNVGATSPADGDLVSMVLGEANDSILLDSDGVYVAVRLRAADLDQTKIAVGFDAAPAAVNSSALDNVMVVFDSEDAADAVLLQANGAGTDVEGAFSALAADYATLATNHDGEWIIVEVAATDTNVTARVTTSDTSETVTLDGPTMPVVGLAPTILVENVGAAEEAIDLAGIVVRHLNRDDSSSVG